jgi:hypothetical protein
LEDKLLITRGLKITEHMVEHTHMFVARGCSVLPESCNGVGQVRPGTQHWIHKCPNCVLISFDVRLGGGELGEMLVWKRGSADGADVGLSKLLKDLINEFLLGQGNPPCVSITGDVHAKNP